MDCVRRMDWREENTMYRRIDVWRRLSATECVRYTCLEDLELDEFCVQSADFFHNPVNAGALSGAENRFLELLMDIDPRERCRWFGSLAEAISTHEQDFKGISPG
jgi:hypothetical protein